MATTLSVNLRPQRRIRRAFFVALGILLLTVTGVALWLYFIARSALPQLDGNIAVPGLHASVIVNRDSHGVPTIQAIDFEDLFFAQGYVTAQDRLFQMDSM